MSVDELVTVLFATDEQGVVVSLSDIVEASASDNLVYASSRVLKGNQKFHFELLFSWSHYRSGNIRDLQAKTKAPEGAEALDLWGSLQKGDELVRFHEGNAVCWVVTSVERHVVEVADGGDPRVH